MLLLNHPPHQKKHLYNSLTILPPCWSKAPPQPPPCMVDVETAPGHWSPSSRAMEPWKAAGWLHCQSGTFLRSDPSSPVLRATATPVNNFKDESCISLLRLSLNCPKSYNQSQLPLTLLLLNHPPHQKKHLYNSLTILAAAGPKHLRTAPGRWSRNSRGWIHGRQQGGLIATVGHFYGQTH